MWKGLVPYRDLFDHKQPLIYPVYAVIDLFGQRTSSVRVAAMTVAAFGALAVAVLARPLLGRARATLAGCVIAVVSAAPFVEGFDLNTEHLLAPITAAAVLVSIRYRRHRWAVFGAGVLLGLGAITKAIGVLAAPAVFLPLVSVPLDRRDLGRKALVFTGAAALPLIVILLVYVVTDGLGALVDANITYNRSYVGAQDLSLDRFIEAEPVLIASLAAVALGVGIARLLFARGDRTGVIALLLWLGGAWTGAKFGGRDFPHYFAPVLAPAIILILVPFGPLVRPTAKRWVPGVVLLMQLGALAWLVRSLPAEAARMFGRQPENVALVIYGEQARVWAEYQPVGALLRARADPGETLFVAGAEPGFYWFSGAPVAGRYPYDYPVLTDARRLHELQEDLCGSPPSRIVIPSGTTWPAYLGILDPSSYDLEFVHHDVHVFRRGDTRPCTPS